MRPCWQPTCRSRRATNERHIASNSRPTARACALTTLATACAERPAPIALPPLRTLRNKCPSEMPAACRSDQRASGEGWRRLYQSRAHLSACLERQERRGHAVSSLASQRQKIQQAQGQEFGARADSEPRRYRSAASYCRRKKPHRRLGGRHDYRRQSQRRCHVARRANLQIHQARQTAGQERGLCRAGLRTRALAAR